MPIVWMAAASLAAAVPLACGDRWVAPPLESSGAQEYVFEAQRGDHIVFETFEDAAAPRPVNPQVELVRTATGERIAFNNDKAFGDLHARLEACIPQTASWTVRVRVWSGTVGGSYRAAFTCSPADLPADPCGVTAEFGCGPLAWRQTSRCLMDDVDPGRDGCTGFTASGGDAVMALRVGRGWELDATLRSEADAVLYVVEDCRNAAATCIAGADRGLAGEPETLRVSFHDAGLWYLVLDHHGGGRGPMSLSGVVRCPEVPVRPVTWTHVRRLYRE